MRIHLDNAKCTGLGLCESFAPDVFEVQDDGTLLVHVQEVGEDRVEEVRQAVASCPTEALTPDFVRCSAAAAAVKPPCSMTWQKTS